MLFRFIKTAFPALVLFYCAACGLPRVEDCNLVPKFTFLGDAIVSIGDTIQLTDSSTATGALSYTWFYGDGANGSNLTGQSSVHVFSKLGEFEVRLSISTDGCPDESYSRTFIVRDTTIPPPVAKITVMASSGLVPFDPGFKNKSNGQINTYEWDFGDGFNSPEFEPAHSYQTADTFRVILKVTGPGGVDRDTVFVEAKPVTFDRAFDMASGNTQEFARLVAENPAGGFWVATNDNEKTATASVPANGNTFQPLETFDVGPDFSKEFVQYGIADSNGFSFAGVAHFTPGMADGDDFYLLRLKQNFLLQDLRSILDNTNDGNEVGYGVAAAANGDVVLCGRKSSVGTNLGMYFIKVFANGNISRVAQFTSNQNNTAYCILQKSDAGYAVVGRMSNAGTFNSCFFTLDSNLGNPSTPVFFGNTTPTDFVQLPTGGYLLLLRDGSSGKLIKLLESGAVDWEIPLPNMTVQRLTLTHDGKAAIVGWSTAGSSVGVKLLTVNLTTKVIVLNKDYLKTNFIREGHCLVQLADNGFLLGGSEKDAAGTFRTLLIRTDALGNVSQ